MSRIMVKNLPKIINADKLKDTFSIKGEVTDVQLKYTKDGRFRQFAFIGFKKESEALAAIEYFNETFMGTSKIKAEKCMEFGSKEIKPWSKYTKEKIQKDTIKNPSIKPKENNDPDELSSDKGFAEFLEVHKKRGDKMLWSNDGDVPADVTVPAHVPVVNKGLKDGTKIKKRRKKPKNSVKSSKFTVKILGLPPKTKRKDIRTFFMPHKFLSMRQPENFKSMFFVQFEKEKGYLAALRKHLGFFNGKQVQVISQHNPDESIYPIDSKQCEEKLDKTVPAEIKEANLELLTEYGRILVKNIPYSTTEDEMTELFKKYGPISEVHIPYDKFLNRIRGIAFVTYLFPEHAVKAYSELYASSFQGRNLALEPAKPLMEETDKDKLSFKEKKIEDLKSKSTNLNTWNTLFLGANTVAEVMAEKYDVSKAKILDSETNESLAVRMALGETQIVSETKEFLISNGVDLDSFKSGDKKERSKTIILAKNLSAKTKEKDLRPIFEKFGQLSRLVLPPSGVTAIIEFVNATEAKIAFKNLAYSRFKDCPLYLEWAPTNVFKNPPEISIKEETKEEVKEEKRESDVEDAEDNVPGTTLFVKNLNFETTDQDLIDHFSQAGKIRQAVVSKKKDIRSSTVLSMGFGFVEFKKAKYAKRALKEMQHTELQGHQLELKLSTSTTLFSQSTKSKTKTGSENQKSSKILVKNIPFEATKKEIKELFKVFGELKTVRLPLKGTGSDSHRGFGFVDFVTRHDAKRAMKTLSDSTHLYGRRLVLEWAATDDEEVETLRRKTAEAFLPGLSNKKKLKQAILDEL